MNRRELLKGLVAVPLVPLTSLVPETPPETYKKILLYKWEGMSLIPGPDYRVFVEDVLWTTV